MEFEPYTVTVTVETDNHSFGHRRTATRFNNRTLCFATTAATEPGARANHAVACQKYGLRNVWPVSEGELSISTQTWVCDVEEGWATTVWRVGSSSVVLTCFWPTEAEAAEGHKAVARRYGAL
jgi:hypothetical protein